MKKSLFIIFLLIKFSLILYGQKNELPVITLKEFIENNEEKHGVKFYFKEDWLEKYFVYQINTDSLEQLLERSFKYNNQLRYFIYKDHNIILSEIEKIDLSKNNLYVNNKTIVNTNVNLQSKDVDKQIHRIGVPGSKNKVGEISGVITEQSTGKALEGVQIIADEGIIGTTTNKNGEYTIFLPKGYHILNYRYVGMEPTLRKVQLFSKGNLNVELVRKNNLISEVTVIGAEEKKEKQTIGFKKLKLLEINELPSFMGEVDIIKHSLLLPGIQSVGEMDMSFSVRGGKGDQNLILVDGMHTYSHSHFFGFFPGINPYSIENASLYKASMPIEYGNRLSSVYDIEIKKGNNNKIELEGGVSPVSSNIAFSGPIIKNKLSVNTSYRGTYSNWVLNLIDVDELERSDAMFYDYLIKLNFKPDSSSNINLFFNDSYDDFSFNDEQSFAFANRISSLKYKKIFENGLIWESVLGYTNYINQRTENPAEGFSSISEHSLQDYKLNTKFKFLVGEKNNFTSGLELIYHEVKPWNIEPYNSESVINPVKLNKEKALQASIYLGDKVELFSNFRIDAGIRLSSFFFLGPNNEFSYKDNILLEDYIVDTVQYANNEIIKSYIGPEIRISGNYSFRLNQNINFCYNRNRQYISILTNSQAITPVSSWQLSNGNIPPQIADHYSIGYNREFQNKMFSTSVEVYYKNIKNIKDFVNGSNFELNPHPETEIVNAKGKSYGLELLLKKNKGRLKGWISYTYSRSFIKSDNEISEKQINEGSYYPSSYDKPNNLSAVINYEPTKRIILSNVINYSSGTPATLPVSKIELDGNYYLIYSDRNEFRLPYYLRWDISISFRGSLKRNKIFSSLWIFSVYNVLGRNNPYSVYFENNKNRIQGYQLSIFGNPIPTITYKFNF